jgi:hypothetical protein
VFDAGTIEARLSVDTSQAKKDLDRFRAEVKAFEDDGHKIKISAVFDNSSVAKARADFAALDNAISKDAMNRLRSSPQGSVLGSLNALFSPHSVTGAPSASQAAQQGLLGKMVSNQGGGIGSTRTEQKDTINRVIGVSDTSARDAGAKAGKDAADAASDAATSEAKKKGGGWFTGLLGGIGASLSSAAGGLGGLLGGAAGGEAGGKKGAENAGGGAAGLAGNIAGGAGANLFGMSTKATAIVGAVGTALAALPALGGVIGAGLGTALIGGAIAGVVATSPKLKKQFSALGGDAEAVIKAAAGPIVPALSAVIAQVPGLLKTLQAPLAGIFKTVAPQLMGVFNGLRPILSGVIDLMKAAAPAFGPFIESLEKLVSSLFPGLVSITAAVVPVMKQFEGIMGQLGGDIGALFGDMAPAVKASMTVLGALFSVIGSLLPDVAKLADVFAEMLAPVIGQLAGLIKSLLPFLSLIGTIGAELANTILGDVVSILVALVGVLKSVAPSLDKFAAVLAQVFNVMENYAVFDTLADVIEDLVKPLGVLINALLGGLLPVIPPILNAIIQLSTVIAGGLVQAITQLLPPMTKLAVAVLGTLARILPAVLPLLVTLAGIFTGALVSAISAVATVLAEIINAIPPKVLAGIVTGILAIVGAMKLLAIIQGILDATDPFTLVIIGIGLLVAAAAELVVHWRQVWGFIKSAAEDAWNFIWNGFGKYLLPLLGPVGVIALGAIELYQHWSAIWSAIYGTTMDAWHLLDSDIWQPMERLFTQLMPGWFSDAYSFLERYFIDPYQNGLTAMWDFVVRDIWDPFEQLLTQQLPGWFNTAVNYIKQTWSRVESIVRQPVASLVDNVFIPLANVFDAITNAVGLGKPVKISRMSSGGRVPGYGGGDVVPALIERGEAVIDKDRTKKYAWLFQMMGVPGFAKGGLPGANLGGGLFPTTPGQAASNPVAGILSKGWDITRIMAAIATGNATALDNAFASLTSKGAATGAKGLLDQVLTDYPKTVVKDIVSYLIGNTAGAGAAIPGGTSGTVSSWIQQALKIAAKPLTWLSPLLTLVGKESGGNPRAIDPISVDGEHAEGVAQMLPSTFAQYSLGGSLWNPVAELIAAIRYIAATYVTPFAIPGLLSGNYVGYANGGVITEPVIGYGTNSGRIYTLAEREAEVVTPMSRLAAIGANRQSGGPSGQQINVGSITMPEGATLAQTMQAMAWRMRIEGQRQYWSASNA